MKAFLIPVASRQAEIDDVDLVFGLIGVAYKEVLWLNVSMNYSFQMYLLDNVQYRLGYEAARFDIKLAVTMVE